MIEEEEEEEVEEDVLNLKSLRTVSSTISYCHLSTTDTMMMVVFPLRVG